MNIKYKKLNALAKEPTFGSEMAAGADLYAAIPDTVWIDRGERVLIDTGIAVELPRCTFGGIYPRSGLSFKRGLRLSNCVGVIDADYRDSIKVALYNDSNLPQYVEPGERIAQLIIRPCLDISFEETDILSDTERGLGGFGSTGTK